MIRSVLLCGLVAAVTVAPSMPAAAAGCAAGFQDAGGNFCTATFVYSGAPEMVTLPAGISAIIGTVSGAEGGTSLEEQVDPSGGAPSPGGKGGRETATLSVVPGATLTVVVGQAGTGGGLAPPGYGGYGGGGHATSRYGGNGGGGSYIFDDSGPLIAAGGGGGGGYDYNPVARQSGDQQAPGGNGSGASPAGDGQSVAFCCDTTFPPPQHVPPGGGGGATPTGPGLGGHPNLPPGYSFGQVDGDPGSGPALDPYNFGNGGNTHNACCYYIGWAGGGGGGYYGGGGGGNIEADLEGGGGGGGAGYASAAAIKSSAQTGVQIGDGEVVITYYTGACDASCATCSGPTSSDCTSCANGLSLVNGACVLVVPTPTATPTPTVPLQCHDSCSEGPPQSPQCDACVQSICAVDPYCCETLWDQACVSEVISVCGGSCSGTPTPTNTPMMTDTPAAPTPTTTDTPAAGTATATITPTPTLGVGCPAVPDNGCFIAEKNRIMLKNSGDVTKRKLVWKWTGGTIPLAQGDFGDPLNGSTGYSICVYDSNAGVAQLEMGLSIAPNGVCAGAPCWGAVSDKGWSYKNRTGNSDGITSFKPTGGLSGRSKIKLIGKGTNVPMPMPLSTSQFFAQDPAVIVQLHSNGPIHCWASTFGNAALHNDGGLFKAKTP